MLATAVRAFLAIILCLSIQAGSPVTAAGGLKERILQGSVSQSEIIDTLERVGIKCEIHQGANPALVVQTVRLGSAAYYKGVTSGDAIKGLVSANDHFLLTIERSGKIYQVSLQLLNSGLDERTTVLSGSAHKDDKPVQKLATAVTKAATQLDSGAKTLAGGADDTMLTGNVEEEKKKQEQKLAQYDIEAIVDISGSMGDEDGTNGLSKFQWCHDQVRSLAQKLAPYKKSLTITTFNNAFNTYEDCDPSRLEEVYSTVRPHNGTDLVDPLMSRLDNATRKFAQSKHRVLIAVITDGMPNIPRDPHIVNRAIIDYTQTLTDPDAVKVTVLQIGDTFEGKDFCMQLDDGLVAEGAKFDIVDTETFDDLKQGGITNALIDAILDKKSSSLASIRHLRQSESHLSHQAAKEAEHHLQQLQDERKQLESQIFGK